MNISCYIYLEQPGHAELHMRKMTSINAKNLKDDNNNNYTFFGSCEVKCARCFGVSCASGSTNSNFELNFELFQVGL